nr:hypothetical protein [Candidatus Dependentiae bacterium]
MSPLSYLLEYNRIYNILGIFVILAIAAAMSHNRSRISWRLVITALCLHATLAFFVLKTVWGRAIIGSIAGGFTLLYQAAD